MIKQKTLEDLYTDSLLLNETEVTEAILPLISIQRGSNKIFFKHDNTTNIQKIVAYMLAKKLIASKETAFSERITAAEIFEELNLKRGTTDGTLGKLRKDKILVGSGGQDGGYEIPSYKIKDALIIINK